MVRPRDLPLPVREHRSHDVKVVSVAPGVGTYTLYSQRSTIGGAFSRAARFRSFGDPASGDSHPGPCYNPTIKPTSIGITFKGPAAAPKKSDSASGSGQSTPGPGAYDVVRSFQMSAVRPTAVSFTVGKRGGATDRTDSAQTPGPDAYTPSRPSSRKATAFIGTSTRADLFTSAVGDSDGAAAQRIPSLDTMDRCTAFVRPSSASISFPKARAHGELGGGSGHPRASGGEKAYAKPLYVTDDVIRPDRKAPSFGTAVRPSSATSTRSAPSPPAMPVIGAHDVHAAMHSLSTTAPAPSVGFSRAGRGVASGVGSNDVPCDRLYVASFTQIDPQVRLCVPWRPSSRPASASSARSAPDPPFLAQRSTLTGPAITFPQSKRGQVGGGASAAPGPGAYEPRLPRRPDSATRSIPQAKRDFALGLSGHDAEEGHPGLLHPDVSLTKPSAPSVGIARPRPQSAPNHRPGGAGAGGTSASDARSYQPLYTHIDKGHHAAILYLTG